MCILYNGALIKSNYTCPSTMNFNPTTQMCSATDKCIDTVCVGKSPLQKIPDPNSADCKTYIQCVGILTLTPVIQTCTVGFYNDDYKDCWLWGKCK